MERSGFEHVNKVTTRVMKQITETRSKEMSEVKSHKVYTIIKNDKGKDFWIEIGRAFTNKDNSLNVRLNALPVNGTLQIRVNNPAK